MRRFALAGVIVFFGAAVAVPPWGYSQGTGFTGDTWYWIANGNYTVVTPGSGEWTGVHHSYGFNSTTNISASNNGYVASYIINQTPTTRTAAEAYGYNLARACVHGTYPNCTDTDGWTGYARTKNQSSVNLRLKGHGVY
jgi:hypothetical protein